ncbi:MAG: hypothetical protein GXO76_10780 [Calditrichaeota bacterium]|nr:hypothetical protein [Calditrichota bacterium]
MELNLLDYFIVLFRRKWLIVGWVAAAMIFFYGISFFLPKWYQARTSVLPPAQDVSSSYLQMVSQMPLQGFLPTASPQQSKIFLQMLQSRTLKERLIQRFDLQKRWKQKSLEKTLRALSSRTDMMDTRNGMIILQVKARSPQLAARLANGYIEELDRLNREKMISRAKNARIYIARQIDSVQVELRKASAELADFQKSHKAISLPDQMKEAIKEAGQLKGQIVAKKVEYEVLRKTMKPNNPKLQFLLSEIQALQKQYETIQFGGDRPLTQRKEFFIAFSEAPEVGIQLAALTRRTRILESVFQLLNQQYYRAKIEEAKTTPTVQTLDKARVPERKCCPSRLLIAFTGGFVTFVLLVFFLWTSEYLKDLQRQNPEEFQRWEKLKRALRLFPGS